MYTSVFQVNTLAKPHFDIFDVLSSNLLQFIFSQYLCGVYLMKRVA